MMKKAQNQYFQFNYQGINADFEKSEQICDLKDLYV